MVGCSPRKHIKGFRPVAKRVCAFLAPIVLLFALAVPALSDHGGALVFLHYWTGPLSGGIDDMTRTFNRSHPDIKFKATGFEHESFKVGIQAMLAGETPPDMFSYWAGARVKALVDKGLLAPIDDIWASTGLDSVFPPSVSRASTYDGHKYALPVTQHYVAFFYNKQIFRKYGLEPPTDWTQFLAACKTLKENGVTPIALGSRERWPAQFWFDYLLLKTAGPSYRDRLMRGDASYTDPEVMHAFAMWRDLLRAGYFNSGPNNLDWAEAAQLVHSGQAAMTLMGTWIIGLYDGSMGWKQGEGYDFFPFPTITADVPQTCLGPIDVIVVPRRGHPHMAKPAAAYFASTDPQMEMSRGSGALAPSSKVPQSFYSPLQRRILETIRATPQWAFNYDLATPPPVAEIGLNAFRTFINTPDRFESILKECQIRTAAAFHEGPK